MIFTWFINCAGARNSDIRSAVFFHKLIEEGGKPKVYPSITHHRDYTVMIAQQVAIKLNELMFWYRDQVVYIQKKLASHPRFAVSVLYINYFVVETCFNHPTLYACGTIMKLTRLYTNILTLDESFDGSWG